MKNSLRKFKLSLITLNSLVVDNSSTRPAIDDKSNSMTTQEQAQPSQEESATDKDQDQAQDLVQLEKSLGASMSRAVWLASYRPGPEQDPLGLVAAEYTLEELVNERAGAKSEQGQAHDQQVELAERMCSLPENRYLATVQALAVMGDTDQIWYEPLREGTLAQALAHKTEFSEVQVSQLAKTLAYGLQELHGQQIAYRQLGAEHIGFTQEHKPKLFGANRDLSRLEDQERQQAIQENQAQASAILWQCLALDAPASAQHRARLILQHGPYGPRVGQLLEEALQAEAAPDLLLQLAKLLDQQFCQPAKTMPTQTVLLSQVEKPVKKKSAKKLLAYTGLASLLLAGACLFAYDRYSQPSNAHQGPVELVGTVYASPQTEQSSTGLSNPSAEGRQTEQAEAVDLATGSQLTERLKELIIRRSQALTQLDKGMITEYTVDNSEIARADQLLLSAESAQELGQVQMQVVEAEVKEHSDSRATIEALVTAPVAEDEDPQSLAASGIYVVDGQAEQRVLFTLEKTVTGWMLSEAKPVL